MSDAKGPYRRERWEGQNENVVTGPGWERVPGTHSDREADKMALIANIAFEKGRASREGLISAMRTAINQYQHPDRVPQEANHWCSVLSNALEADGEGK